MTHAIDKKDLLRLVHPGDEAINAEATGDEALVAFAAAGYTDDAAARLLTYREGQQPRVYEARPLDAIEYDDCLCEAERATGARVGGDQRAFRRAQILAARRSLVAVTEPDGTRVRGKAIAARAEALPFAVSTWLGGQVMDASSGVRRDHTLAALMRLDAAAGVLRRVVEAVAGAAPEETLEDLGLDADGAIMRAARVALQLQDEQATPAAELGQDAGK